MRDDRQQDLSASGAEHAGGAGSGDAALAGMRRLYELHARLAGETSLHAALREILFTAIQAAGAHRGTVQLVSDDGQRLEIAAHHGYDSPSLEQLLKRGSGPACEAAWRDRRPIVTDDTGVDGVRAVTCTPMITQGGDVAGVVCTEFREPHRPGDDEPRMTGLLAWIASGLVERHRAEVALRKSEEQGSALVSMLPGSAVFIVDTEMRYRFAGGEALRDAGHSSERFLGRTPEEVVGPALAAEHAPNYRRVLGGEPFEVEHAAHGRIFLTRGTPLRDGAGAVTGALVISTDVTARQTEAAALRQSGERQAFLLALSDALRAEADARSVQEQAVRMVAEHLRLDRCWISEVFGQQGISTVGPEHRRPDLSPLSGVFRLSDYNETMRQLATQPMAVYDAPGDPRFADAEKELLAGLRLSALLVVPLRKGPQPVVWALAAAMATPREWTDGERVLLQEAAERTWAAIERARGQAAATRAERHAERLIERMGDAHCVLDRDFRIVRVNAAAERLLGVPRDQMLGRSHRDVFPESVDAPAGVAFRRVRAEGTKQYLTHHYTGEGYDLHLEIDAYPTDEGGVAMFWRDVTERVRAEAALRASEERYRALFNEMDEAYAVVEVLADAEGRWADFRFLEVNPAFVRHTGMPYPVGRTATELLGTPNPRWAELYGRAADTGETVRVEEAELTLGRTFDLNIFRLGGEGSRRVAVLFADVTERRRAEDALRESEERYRSLFESMDEGFALCELVRDDDGRAADYRYVELNPALVRHSGITPGALRGRRATEVFPDLDPWLIQTYGRVVDTGESVIAEHYFPHVDRWLRLNAFPRGGDRFAVLFGDVTERKRTEEELRESERRHRLLFENMGEGFALAELIRDEDGRPIDWRYLEVNDGWAQTGVPAGETVGRTAREVNPAIEPGWIEAYGRVVRTGEPTRYEAYAKGYGKWFDTVAFRHSENRFGLILRDVTARREAEAALRASAERQAFLLKLGDALRLATSASGIERAAARTLGAALGANRAFYAGVDGPDWLVAEAYEDGVEPQALGRHPLAQFGGWILDGFRAGERLVIRDLHADPRFDAPQRAAHEAYHILAAVAVPLVKEGVFSAILVVHSAIPRDWSEDEIALVEETAERTWAAVRRARAEAALRASEARFRALFESIDEGFVVAELRYGGDGRAADAICLEGNPAASRLTGVPDFPGRSLSEVMPGAEPYWVEVYDRVARTGAAERLERYLAPVDRWYDFHVSRLVDGEGESAPGGSPRVAVVFQDVTVRRRAEEALRASEARQVFLLRLSDALRAEPDTGAIALTSLRLLAAELGVDRCYVAVMDPATGLAPVPYQVSAPGVPPVPPVIQLNDYPAQFRRIYDQTLVVHDAATEPGLTAQDRASLAAIEFGALVAATLRRVEDGERRPVWAIVAVSAAPRRWTPGEVALAEEVAERTWAAMERARSEAALRASEEEYRTLFETMAEGFCVVEVLRDEAGEAVDLLCLELNPAFEHQTGLVRGQVAGRRLSEVYTRGDVVRWVAPFARVADSGEPAPVEGYAERIDRWFEGSMYPRGGDRVAVFYHDVTTRRQAERVVRESQERQAFLLALSDALRACSGEHSITQQTVTMLGEHLRLDRCYVSEVFEEEGFSTVGPEHVRPGFPSMVGRYRLSDYPETQRQMATQPLVIDDAEADPRFSDEQKAMLALVPQRALLVAPLRRGPRSIVWALAGSMASPRRWTGGERALFEEVAERTWAAVERARAEAALREREEKYRTLFETMGQGYVECELIRDPTGQAVDYRFIEVNPAFERLTGIPAHEARGRTNSEVLPGVEGWWVEAYDRIVRAGVPERIEYHVAPLGRWYEAHVYPRGGDRFIVLYEEITARRQADEALRESEERQAFLLRLSDALRAEPTALAVAGLAIRMLIEHLRLDRAFIISYRVADDRADLVHQAGNDTVPPAPDYFILSDYPVAFGQTLDQTVVIEDELERQGLSEEERRHYGRSGQRAMVAATVRRGERIPLASLLAVSSRPRRWTRGEIALVEAVAERTWSGMERARAEAELRASEEQFRRSIEEAPIPVIMHAEDGEVLQISRTWTELTGYALGDVPTFDAWLTRAYGHGADRVREHVHALFSGERRTMSIDIPVRARGGELRHWSFSASAPGTLHDGRRFVVGMALDVTDRLRANAALRESEERFRLFAEASSDVLWMRDAERLRWEYLSPAFESVYGYPRAEVTGTDDPRHWGELIEPEDRGRALAALQRVRDGERVTFEYRIRRADGEVRWLRNTDFPIRDSGGRVWRIGGIGQDVTEQRRREENQALLVDISADLNQLSTEEDIVRTVGARLAARLDLACYHYVDVDEARGQVTVRHFWHALDVPSTLGTFPISGFVPPDGLDVLRAGVTSVVHDVRRDLADGSPATAALVAGAARQKIGAWIVVPYSRDGRWKAYFAAADGAPRRWTAAEVELIQEVASRVFPRIERVRAEAALRDLNETLEQRVEERTAELVRAHEARRQVLRQLVTAEEDERRRISRELHDSLGQLVTGLLLGLKTLPRDGETARIQDLERLTDRIAREMQNMAVQLRPPALDNLGLRLALQAHVEEWSHRYALECDFHSVGVDGERFSAEVETTLYRVVQEGLNNVVKHARATRVSLLLERRNGMIGVILEDDGRGFEVEATLASPEKARRLGLRGMRERVALLGGELEIESSEGAGTTLYVRIPLPAAAEGTAAAG